MTNGNYPRGSEWRRWDLHVHTPDSLVNTTYGAGGGDPWEQFLSDLESLPPEFAVIGINDYLFLDGYRKVTNARANGRLKNIACVLPVVELRLSLFAGADGDLSRINYHVIFSDELSADQIDAQFLAALRPKYQLAPGAGQGLWNGVVDRQSLAEFGQKVIESSPPEVRTTFPSALITGFNNLCIPQLAIEDVLRSPYFKDKFITAVGKAEWASMTWTAQAAATKKDLINSVNLVFSALENHKDYTRHRKVLTNARVNDRLVDCSDAHHLKNSAQKDRVGNCFTWVKSDPTFKGLLHALKEFDQRVYVGILPPSVARVRSNATKYIQEIAIEKDPFSSLKESWFECKLPLNAGLAAIIGNKGSGKSALADCIALAGHTQVSRGFSFLNERKFRRKGKDNLSVHFVAEMTWLSGLSNRAELDKNPDPSAIELVKYVPQNFLEEICNDPKGTAGFESELKAVIYSHVPPSEKLGQNSLDDLIKYKTEQIEQTITAERNRLSRLNFDIIQNERKLFPEHRKKLEALQKLKQEQLQSHERSVPKEVKEPTADSLDKTTVTALEQLRAQRQQKASQIETTEGQLHQVVRKFAICDRLIERLANLRSFVEETERQSLEDLQELGVDTASVFQVRIDDTHIFAAREQLTVDRARLDAILSKELDTGLPQQMVEIAAKIGELEEKLSEPVLLYQEYLEQKRIWTETRDALIGAEDQDGSLLNLKSQLSALDKVPTDLSELRLEREKTVVAIHQKLEEILRVYEQCYNPVREFAQQHKLLKDKIGLSFAVSLEMEEFETRFFEFISRGAGGYFYGESGPRKLQEVLQEFEWNDRDDVVTFLVRILNNLTDDGTFMTDPSNQLKKGTSLEQLYDFLYGLSYLVPQYKLRLNNKDIEQLSPGERGLLLLVFYLLIDQADIPLIIDQPEENLDNQTVFETLVPAIKEAKQRRQVIIVTHNPNLAVVCDAEQLIHAQLERAADTRIEYSSGSLEDPVINRKVVDILEGTRPAFDNRDSKYH